MIVTICLHHLFFFSLSFNFFSSFPALPSLPNLFCPILLHPLSRRCFVPHLLSSSPVISPFPPLLLLLLPLLLFDLNSASKKLFYHHHHKDREKKKKVEAKCNIFPSSSRSNSQHIFLCRRLRRSRSSSVGNRSKEVKSKRSAITEEKNEKRERRKKDVWRDGGGGGGAERVVHLCPSTMQNIERKEKERKKVDFPLFLLHFKKRLFRFFSFFSLSLLFSALS